MSTPSLPIPSDSARSDQRRSTRPVFDGREQVDLAPSAPYRTRVVKWQYLDSCNMILSHHRPRRVIPYSAFFDGAEYDALDYDVPDERSLSRESDQS